MFKATGGLVNTYKLLLGNKVVTTMVEKIGSDNANKFLKLHAKYDACVRKNPKIDPMQAMPASDIPVFQDFGAYTNFLKRLESQLRGMKEPMSRYIHGVLVEMVKVADTELPKQSEPNEKNEAATASFGSGVRYGKTMFRGHSLIQIPVFMKDTKSLPYSYPSWDASMEMITKLAEEKGYQQRLEAELTNVLKSSLVRVFEALPSDKHKTVKELVVEAQEYLMDHNWISYGLENVAKASYNIACAGVKHRVGTDGSIKHIMSTRTLAYAFLGVGLETVLRRACFALLKEATSNMVFAGKNASLDVITACCSCYVQEVGREWLDNLQSKLK